MDAVEEEHLKRQRAKYLKVPIGDLIVPKNGHFTVMVDQWWSVTDDNCILFYSRRKPQGYSAPQCNSNESIARSLNGANHYPWPTQVEQIPVVYLPLRFSDYE